MQGNISEHENKTEVKDRTRAFCDQQQTTKSKQNFSWQAHTHR